MADRSFSWFLTLIRVLMGAFFLMEAEHQLVSGWIGGDGLAIKIQKAINDTAIPPYGYFLDHVALKADDPLTILVIIGEIQPLRALDGAFAQCTGRRFS
jgi:hypothetical protein